MDEWGVCLGQSYQDPEHHMIWGLWPDERPMGKMKIRWNNVLSMAVSTREALQLFSSFTNNSSQSWGEFTQSMTSEKMFSFTFIHVEGQTA